MFHCNHVTCVSVIKILLTLSSSTLAFSKLTAIMFLFHPFSLFRLISSTLFPFLIRDSGILSLSISYTGYIFISQVQNCAHNPYPNPVPPYVWLPI